MPLGYPYYTGGNEVTQKQYSKRLKSLGKGLLFVVLGYTAHRAYEALFTTTVGHVNNVFSRDPGSISTPPGGDGPPGSISTPPSGDGPPVIIFPPPLPPPGTRYIGLDPSNRYYFFLRGDIPHGIQVGPSGTQYIGLDPSNVYYFAHPTKREKILSFFQRNFRNNGTIEYTGEFWIGVGCGIMIMGFINRRL